MPAIAAAMACWADWRKVGVTKHDGHVRTGHPVIRRAIAQTQSATSLRLMLRDPLGFIWRYGLGWRSTVEEEQPLSIDVRSFGELVHRLLKRTVDGLEPKPGYLQASRQEIETALQGAKQETAEQWPLDRATPPLLLWLHTLEAAASLSLKALTLDEGFRPGTRSWTEVVFGEDEVEYTPDLPWDPRTAVLVGNPGMRIRGSIDRLDLNAQGDVRVSDYKTGAEPKQAERIVLGGGAELQRVIYALATRQLLGDERRIVARLLFLGSNEPRELRLADIDAAILALVSHLEAARTLLEAGAALPGPDAHERWNDLRLALPATASVYFRRKQSAFGRAFGDFSQVWSNP